jgi:phage baseplate assembly protein W
MDFLGVDLAWLDGDLAIAASGDAAVAVGVECWLQGLLLRLGTPRGDLAHHPEYGFDLMRYLHAAGSPANTLDLALGIAAAIEADPRSMPGSARVDVREFTRERIVCEVRAQPLDGPSPVSFVLGWDVESVTPEVVRG